ncbi:MAG TPA: hypothetical protein VE821_02740, partial [Pyrinomonadaceae bacterium]|nr:hypothetical protein [Pyrinomonadaceae bacterium]
MTTSIRLIACLCFFICCSLVASAQTLESKAAAATESNTGPLVTLSPTASGVRVLAQGAISHVRLEVYPIASDERAAPDALLTTRFARGNLHDWALTDGQGQPLPDGKYLFVITARDLNAQLWFKKVTLVVQSGQAAVELTDAGELGAGEQKQKPVAEAPAVTVTAHTGQASHIVSTRGGFSFRV